MLKFIQLLPVVGLFVAFILNFVLIVSIYLRWDDFYLAIMFFLLTNFIVILLLYIYKREQKRYELSLSEAKEKALITLASIGDAVITTDVDGNVTFLNAVAKKLTEHTGDDIYGRPIDEVLELCSIESGEKIKIPINDVLHNNLTKLISNGTKLISKSKKEYIISDSAAAVKDKNGKILGTVLVFQDNTQRHLVVDELQKSHELNKKLKERMELALHGSNDGLWDWDIVTNEVYFSPRWKEILGYSDDELPSEFSSWESRVHPDDMEPTMAGLQENMEGKTEYYEGVHRMKHKDGHWVWILERGKTTFDENGKPIRMNGTHTDITAQKKLEDELKEQKDVLAHQAHHDALTGLPNRILFNDRLEQAIEKAKRYNTKMALLFIDLDHFKEINDSLGHETGDKILKAVTQRLEGTIRDKDTLARLGGDEFTIIMEDLINAQDASLFARKILKVLAKSINVEENILYVSSSIGISLYPDDGDSSANLLKYADSAMYKAKAEGRNNFQFYSAEMTEIAFERVIMETSIREALEHDGFIVYYQPQVNGIDNQIVGMEALVRWKHNNMGLISPDKFITIAESTGLIVEIDRFVMKTAMEQFAKWYAEGLNPGVLAMNLSTKQLQRKDFISVFKDLIKETGCKPEWLELEVTEGQIMSNPEEFIKVLNQISGIGVALAIDDFGAGYSSFSYLKKLPINKLKIDQSFVRDLPNDKENAAIARAVIALVKSLNLRVIAESIETKEQKDFMVENGCDNIQGYFYAKPMPANELKSVLLKGLIS